MTRNAESVRFRVPVDVHEHEDPPDAADAVMGYGCDDDAIDDALPAFDRVWRENGVVLYRAACDKNDPVPVRAVWARPLSGRGGAVCLMQAGKKREIAYIPDLAAVPEESRRVIEEDLAESMILPVITKVREVRPRFGNYYFDVETDHGARTFLLRSPENNSMHPSPDVVVLRDASGNCYEIASLSALDKGSLRELDRAL